MMNNFQASKQGCQPGKHRINQGQTIGGQKEDPKHIRIEDLVVEEINKQNYNGPL